MVNWIMDAVRGILFAIDQIIYELINIVYNLFIYISRLSFFSNNDFVDFQKRIFLILGIVMLFKIAFSLISIFVNPDDLFDSKKGVTGIVQRIMISLIAITFVPTIFSLAYKVQGIVLKDNIIGNFFLGTLKSDEQSDAVTMQVGAGKMIAMNVLHAFYYPEPTEKQATAKIYDKNGNPTDKTTEVPQIDMDGVGEGGGLFTTKRCSRSFPDICGPNLYYYTTNVSYSISDYGKFITEKHEDDNGDYAMHYSYLISTIAGIVVLWMFVGFCFDAAIRSVKLGALQLIAPIPIFSYIDPKKGETVFKSWLTTCMSTYLSLFGRLALIYFVIYLCYLLNNHGFMQISSTGDFVALEKDNLNYVALAFMYIGLLMFAKDAPKLFSEMFGIKMESSFGTKMTKLGLAATTGAVAVGATKFATNKYNRLREKSKNNTEMGELNKKYLDKNGKVLNRDQWNEEDRNKYNEKMQENKWRTGARRSVTAVGSGLLAGGLSGGKGGKFGMSQYNQSMSTSNANQQASRNGMGPLKRTSEKWNRFAGSAGKYGDFGDKKNELKDLENEKRRLQTYENRYREKSVDDFNGMSKDFDFNVDEIYNFQTSLEHGNINDIAAAKTDLIFSTSGTIFTAAELEDKEYVQKVKIKYEQEFEEKNQDPFKQIQKSSELATKYDTEGQRLEKSITKVKKQLGTVGDGK